MNIDSSEGVAIFTDGSASSRDRSGGCAWVILDAFDGMATGSEWRSDTTISRMELLAPTLALIDLYEACGWCDVLIYSDSEYVALGCQDRRRKRNTNLDYWENLDCAIQLHTYVEFQHIPGHADIFFNEMADDLAGKARKKGLAISKDC